MRTEPGVAGRVIRMRTGTISPGRICLLLPPSPARSPKVLTAHPLCLTHPKPLLLPPGSPAWTTQSNLALHKWAFGWSHSFINSPVSHSGLSHKVSQQISAPSSKLSFPAQLNSCLQKAPDQKVGVEGNKFTSSISPTQLCSLYSLNYC